VSGDWAAGKRDEMKSLSIKFATTHDSTIIEVRGEGASLLPLGLTLSLGLEAAQVRAWEGWDNTTRESYHGLSIPTSAAPTLQVANLLKRDGLL
jgi:hypothetical protein